jgi:hypothetical protein
MKPIEPVSHQTSLSDNIVTIKVLKKDFAGKEITKKEVLNEILTGIKNGGKVNSNWSKYHPNQVGIKLIWGLNVESLNEGLKLSSYKDKLYVDYNSHDIPNELRLKLTYYNGDLHVELNKPFTSDVVLEISIKLLEDKEFIIATITPPFEMTKYEKRNELFGYIYDSYEFSKVEKDINEKLNGLKGLSIDRTYILEAEFNSKYQPDSVFANFDRALGGYASKEVHTNDLEKKKNFSLHYNGEELPLYVSVYPYRNGSKASFSVSLKYKVSEDMTISAQKVASVKNLLKDIVNN